LIEPIFGVNSFKDTSLDSGCAGPQLPNSTCTCIQVYTRLCILTAVPPCQCKYCELGKNYSLSFSHAVNAQKRIQVFMKSVRYFSTILTKTEMEQQAFLKILQYHISRKSFHSSQLLTCLETEERHLNTRSTGICRLLQCMKGYRKERRE